VANKVEVRTEWCPECNSQCGWCSGNAIMMRAVGCATIFPRQGKCEMGEKLKGTTCQTCDGSGKVQVRREILRTAHLNGVSND
jgi:aerobic-type carbon monoxide dehydrogenase small subunit (CoxS/CutS family)